MAEKGSVWLVAGLALAGQISAFGAVTGIDLLSEEHWVWGSAGSATQDYPGGREASYNQTSSDPLDVSVIGTYVDRYFGEFPPTARSKAGDFRVEAQGVYWFSRAYARSFLPRGLCSWRSWAPLSGAPGAGAPHDSRQ